MYKYTTLAKLIVPAFLIFTFSLSAQTPDLPSEVEGVTMSWWSQVQKDLAHKEYVVNYDTKDKSYRAFNRKNGIISSLNAGKFSLKPTLDSGQTEYAWHTSLETASIEFDGVSTYQAKHTSTATQNENTVEFNHKDFTEQYVNTPQGIRQNFILHQGPKANQVRIKVKVNGLSLDKRNDNEIALYEKNKGGIQTHLLYKDIKSWDANGLALASKLDVEGEYIVLVVNTTGAVYPITIDPISTTASTTLESNQAYARFGLSVSSAGDVNGDGYSDVIVGAYRYDNGQTDEGGAFIYHGNNGGSNNYGVLKDYDDDTSSLYTSSSFSDANRGIGLMATSFLGRQKAKLAYETKSNGSSFSGSPFTNGVTNTGIQSSYTDLGISGTELKTTFVKDAFIRVRVKYDPVTAITGQMYGPWRYIKLEELSGAAALPVDLIHFTAQAAAHTTAELTWATATEIDNSHFMIERSYDGEHFEEVARVEGNGNSSEVLHYDYTDRTIAKGTKVAYYRLHQFDYNGASKYSDIRAASFGMNNQDEQNIAIYPNPFTSDVYIDCSTLSGGKVTIVVSNVAGQQLIERSINTTEQIEKVDLSSLPKGMYFVNVTSDTGTTTVKVIKR